MILCWALILLEKDRSLNQELLTSVLVSRLFQSSELPSVWLLVFQLSLHNKTLKGSMGSLVYLLHSLHCLVQLLRQSTRPCLIGLSLASMMDKQEPFNHKLGIDQPSRGASSELG